jgi:hypothetical protein
MSQNQAEQFEGALQAKALHGLQRLSVPSLPIMWLPGVPEPWQSGPPGNGSLEQ